MHRRTRAVIGIVSIVIAALLVTTVTINAVANEGGDKDRGESALDTDDARQGTGTRAPVTAESLRGYTWLEIAAHNTPGDGWIVVDGMVYDISGFVTQHPGGNVFRLGEDNTAIYRSGHGRDTQRIDSFRIGSVELPAYTWDQITAHNRPNDTWIVIDRKVYDISDFAAQHPGGNVFAPGEDNTAIYRSAHGRDTQQINQFQIGVVARR